MILFLKQETLSVKVSISWYSQVKYHFKLNFTLGAGVSAASGLPTFRGKDGIYGNGYKGEEHPARILT